MLCMTLFVDEYYKISFYVASCVLLNRMLRVGICRPIEVQHWVSSCGYSMEGLGDGSSYM